MDCGCGTAVDSDKGTWTAAGSGQGAGMTAGSGEGASVTTADSGMEAFGMDSGSPADPDMDFDSFNQQRISKVPAPSVWGCQIPDTGSVQMSDFYIHNKQSTYVAQFCVKSVQDASETGL